MTLEDKLAGWTGPSQQMVQLLLDLELGVEVDENFESKIVFHDVSWESYGGVAPQAAVSGGFLNFGVA